MLQHIFTEESWSTEYITELPIWRSTWRYIHILTIIERIVHGEVWTANSTKQVCIILYIMKLSALSLLYYSVGWYCNIYNISSVTQQLSVYLAKVSTVTLRFRIMVYHWSRVKTIQNYNKTWAKWPFNLFSAQPTVC